MMYLILHKVRGEPAFDVAHQMECPLCEPDNPCAHCNQGGRYNCDNGHWWITPTSGHRAYPYKTWPLDDLLKYRPDAWEVPEDWPDHYAMNDRDHEDIHTGPKQKLDIPSILRAN